MGRHKSIEELELTEEETGIAVKPSVISLTGKAFQGFSGDSYFHSLREAVAWAKYHNADKNKTTIITLVDYYCQIHSGKSIIMSYNTKSRLTS